jgi:hypothetical protein
LRIKPYREKECNYLLCDQECPVQLSTYTVIHK